MPEPSVPRIPAADLARRLDEGEPLQLLDIRPPERVARGRVTLGATLDFRAVPASAMYELLTLESLRLDPATPVAVICGHGNSSQQATQYLRQRGFDALSVTGGMAAWETVYLPRRLSPTPALQHVVQLDRVGKGALSYVLVSDGDAVVVDPGRQLEPYETLLRSLGATAAAVIDTHMHADYLSGARVAAQRWQVPYFLHPDDARSPYDGAEGRVAYQPLGDGDTIAFGRTTRRSHPTATAPSSSRTWGSWRSPMPMRRSWNSGPTNARWREPHLPGACSTTYTQSVPPRVCNPYGRPAGMCTRSLADTSMRSPSSSITPRPEIVKTRIPVSSSTEMGTAAPGRMTMCSKVSPWSMPGRFSTVWRRSSSAVLGSFVRRR